MDISTDSEKAPFPVRAQSLFGCIIPAQNTHAIHTRIGTHTNHLCTHTHTLTNSQFYTNSHIRSTFSARRDLSFLLFGKMQRKKTETRARRVNGDNFYKKSRRHRVYCALDVCCVCEWNKHILEKSGAGHELQGQCCKSARNTFEYPKKEWRQPK